MAGLDSKIKAFKHDVEKHLRGKTHIVMATAWLVSDNVIIDLFKNHTNMMPDVVGIDTLHVFPETLKVKDGMKAKYGLKVHEYKPEGCNTKADFETKWGKWDTQQDADFDFRSKIEPLKRAFKDLEKQVAITGRRRDQGNERVELDVWEEDKATFNPLASWSWKDVCDYVLAHKVPYNSLHRRVFVSRFPVDPINRNEKADWIAKELDLPYFAYEPALVNGFGDYVYVWKSFGDTHTSCQVQLRESERAGRFVGRENTECGIHTRLSDGRTPHGGKLIDLIDPKNAGMKYQHSMELNERQVCDVELLMNGGFSPLEGFMTEAQYDGVVSKFRLPEGQLFGLPVTLDTDSESVKVGDVIRLTSAEFCPSGMDNVLAFLKVESKWVPDHRKEGKLVYGTDGEDHPAVWHLLKEKKKFNVGGKVFGVTLPERDWVNCKTPREIRAAFHHRKSLVAFQCRNPIHRAHASLFLEVSREYDAEVLVHPIVGPTKSDDFSAKVRKLTYDALNEMLDPENIHFEYLPYNMMVGGPREALQHILVRKNYGCTHMIVGRDHAGCKSTATKEDFYGPYEAQDFVLPLQDEMGIHMIPFRAMVYIPEQDKYVDGDLAKKNKWNSISLSGTEFRRRINAGEDVPEWYAFKPVTDILVQHYGPKALKTADQNGTQTTKRTKA